MTKAAALAGPHEVAREGARGDRAQEVVEVDPDVAGLGQQQRALAGAGVEAQQLQRGLRAVLDLRGEAAIGPPLHAREVLLGVVAEVHPGDAIAAGGRDHAEAHPRVGVAGEGIGVVLLCALAGEIFALMDDAILRDLRLVDLGEGQPRAVPRPPEAVAAVHLLLGDVLGEAVGLAGPTRAAGPLRRRATGGVDDVQLVILYVCELATVAGQLGVERGLVGGVDDEAQGSALAVLYVDVAGQRDEQALALSGPGIGGDAELAHALALAAELLREREVLLGDAAAGRQDQRGLLAGGEVEAIELAGQAALGAAKIGQRAVVGREGDALRVDEAGQGVRGGVLETERRAGGRGVGRLRHCG